MPYRPGSSAPRGTKIESARPKRRRRRAPSQYVSPQIEATAEQLRLAEAVYERNPDWLAQAACATSGLPPEAWDPDWYKPGKPLPAAEAERREQTAERAKQVCDTVCPVQVECMGHASINREWGVWGGAQRTTVPPTGIGRIDRRAC